MQRQTKNAADSGWLKRLRSKSRNTPRANPAACFLSEWYVPSIPTFGVGVKWNCMGQATNLYKKRKAILVIPPKCEKGIGRFSMGILHILYLSGYVY